MKDYFNYIWNVVNLKWIAIFGTAITLVFTLYWHYSEGRLILDALYTFLAVFVLACAIGWYRWRRNIE